MLVDILVPIFVCVVLPVSIVAIYHWATVSKRKETMAAIMEAIRHTDNVDVNTLARELNTDYKKYRTPRQRLNRYLFLGSGFSLAGIAIVVASILSYGLYLAKDEVTVGAVVLAIGIAFLITFFYSRHNIAAEEREFNELVKSEKEA